MIKEEAMQDRELSWISQNDSSTTTPPKMERIATWTVAALQSISTQTVRNSWHQRRFKWFPKDPAEPLVCFPNLNDMIILALLCMPFVAMIKALV